MQHSLDSVIVHTSCSLIRSDCHPKNQKNGFTVVHYSYMSVKKSLGAPLPEWSKPKLCQ